jgi:hypothetical protein
MAGPQTNVRRAVQHTRELQRVLAIPRRKWTEESAGVLARELTEILRRPGGTQTLRPIQAQALFEVDQKGGLAGPIRVGGGKTLLSALIPYVLQSRRPLVLVPAKLLEKTRREFRALAVHWPVPNFIRCMSYELLGRPQAAEELERYQPDLIVADEAHKLKNRKAACTKRVERYVRQFNPRVVVLSGTITSRSIRDFSHLLGMALPPMDVPLPGTHGELEDWSDALDEVKNPNGNPCEPGALRLLADPKEVAEHGLRVAARLGFRRRLVETPGVVATSEKFLGASIQIAPLECDMSAATDRAFRDLRSEWIRPDGWKLTEAMQVWALANQLALGFFYALDPTPPEDWLFARYMWAKRVREILQDNRRNLDSTSQVVDAVEAGYYPDALPLLQEWRKVEPTFQPNRKTVWLDDSVLEACTRWALQGPGIIWAEHVEFGEALAKRAKLAYYGKGGLDARGRYIEQADPGACIIASRPSNFEGRNLQHLYSRNLITTFPPNGKQVEQLLGRTHRDGQEADEVTFDVLLTAREHLNQYWQATADAQYQEHMTGQAQKLVYADSTVPQDVSQSGPRWVQTRNRED